MEKNLGKNKTMKLKFHFKQKKKINNLLKTNVFLKHLRLLDIKGTLSNLVLSYKKSLLIPLCKYSKTT